MIDILWSLPLTIIVFFLARKLATKCNTPLLNPLVISIFIIIVLLFITRVPYSRYFSGSRLLHYLLQPAIVAFALPLYEQFKQIRRYWKAILSVCLLGSFCGIVTGSLIAFSLGATPIITATVLAKSATTAISMAVAGALGGIPAISAICVLLAGILGALVGHPLLNLLHVTHPIARGLAIGSASHSLGTAKCAENSPVEGAFSALALVLCAIITSLIGPALFHLILLLY